eukprot:1161331-Pelagomonas_calceolata.AAC.3
MEGWPHTKSSVGRSDSAPPAVKMDYRAACQGEQEGERGPVAGMLGRQQYAMSVGAFLKVTNDNHT